MNRHLAIVSLFVAACVPEEECLRRIDAAHRDALQDAAACAFDPDGLDEFECQNYDRRPLRTYEAVFCAQAELACINDDDDTRLTCFGSPDDLATTSLDPR